MYDKIYVCKINNRTEDFHALSRITSNVNSQEKCVCYYYLFAYLLFCLCSPIYLTLCLATGEMRVHIELVHLLRYIQICT